MKFPFKLALDKRFDCVGFGLNAIDHLIVVHEYPSFNSKTRFFAHKLSPGGQTATAVVALQRLGMKTAYAGRFGSDSEGEIGLTSVSIEGIDTEFCEVVQDARTQLAFILIDQRSGERTIIWDRDERLSYSRDEAPVVMASLGRVLHMDGHDPPACLKMAEAARKSGTVVSLDVDNIYEGLPDLLPAVDILISSEEFPGRLTGIVDEREALIELHSRFGCEIAGMTLGRRGAIVYVEGSFIESPSIPVPGACRDTTGAGDAFHGGFLYGLLSGEEIETSLRIGNAVAALKCSDLGARTKLPTKSELEAFLASL